MTKLQTPQTAKEKKSIGLVYSFVFLLILFDHYIPYSYSFGLTVLFVILAIVIRGRFPLQSPLLFLLPFVLMIVVGVLGFANDEYYLFFKEIWYTGKIILLIYFGYLCFSIEKNLPKLVYYVTLAISTACFFHLFQLAINPQVWGGNLLRLREIGIGIDGSPYVPLLIIFLKQEGYFKGKKGKLRSSFLLFVCISSIVLSMSRTQMVILVLVFLIIGLRNHLNLIRYGFSLGFTFLFLLTSGVIQFEVTINDVKTNTTFLTKMGNSLGEMTFREYETIGENLNNYRGYEAFRGLNKILESENHQQLFGHGFGSYLDLSDILFSTPKNPKIVTFHNAYIQIGLKCGVIGLILYFFFALKILFKKVKIFKNKKRNLIIESMLVLLGCDILISTFIVAGLYNPFGMKVTVVLLGSTIAYIIYHQKFPQSGLAHTGIK